MKKSVALLSVIAFAALALLIGYARANPGAADPTWGDAGLTATDATEGNDWASAHVLLDDGRYVVAGWFNNFPGDFGVVRYLADGRPDTSFGNGGIVTTAFTADPMLVDAAWAVAARPDGGLYVIGDTCDADYDYCDMGIVAYNPDGSLDERFSDDGLATIVSALGPTYAWPGRAIVQPDEKLVVGGVVFLESGDADLLLARFHPDGTPDETFGDAGVSITDLGEAGNFMQDLMALPGGKLLAVGVFGDAIDPLSSEQDGGYIARFHDDGTLDSDFGGGDGYVFWDNGGEGAAGQHAVLTPDGNLLILGLQTAADGADCTLQRFDLDGNRDMTFGEGGQVVIDSGQTDQCWEMDLAPGDRIVIGGPAFPPEEERMAQLAGRAADYVRARKVLWAGQATRQDETFTSFTARYHLDGTPDTTFGDNGHLRLNILDSAGVIFNLTVQPDGKTLVAGDAVTDLFTARYLGDGPAAQIFVPVVGR